MNKKYFTSKIVALTIAVSAIYVNGDDTLSKRSAKFASKLNEYDMYDYSEYFLKKEIAKNPEGLDLLKIALAETYIGWKKIPLAEVLIAEIKTTSKYYSKAQYIIGMAAIKKGKIDLGVETLQKYVEYYMHNEMDNTDVNKNIENATAYLKWGYEQKGDVEKAENSLDVLFIRGIVNENEGNYLKLVAKLDAAEKMKQLGEPGWELAVSETVESQNKNDVGRPKKEDEEKDYQFRTRLLKYIKEQKAAGRYESSLPSFMELRWYGRSAIYAHSFIQAARAYFLLGQIDKAVEELKGDSVFIKSCDKQYLDMNNPGESPGAGLRYWSARIYEVKSNNEVGVKKITYLTFAFKMFNSVVMKNPGYKNNRKAYESAIKIQKILEDLSEPVEFPTAYIPPAQKKTSPVTAAIKVKMRTKKYAEAIPMLNKVLFANRKAEGIVDCFQQLSLAYLQTDKDLESIAIAMYMLEYYKKHDYTPMAIIDIGNKLWANDKKETAIEMYNEFLNNYSNHQHAPAIATKIALYHYKNALKLAKATKDIKDPQEKNEKIEVAKKMYEFTADKFQWVIENCAGSDYITTAYYVQGSCFTSTKNYEGAVSVYTKFIENSEKASMKDEIKMIKAKMGIASALFQAGQRDKKLARGLEDEIESAPKAEKAVKLAESIKLIEQSKKAFVSCLSHLQELTEKWLTPDGLAGKKSNDLKLLKTKRSSTELIAYAYDAAGKKKVATTFFEAFIKAYPNDKKVPAAMSRRGIIFAELEDFDTSAKVLGELSKKYPESKEAKSALFTLAKNMYDIKRYDEAIKQVKKIFDSNQSLTIQKLRWIAKNFVKCKGTSAASGSIYALKAGEKLLELIKKPVYLDWLGADLANSLKDDSKQLLEKLNIVKQRIQYDAAMAANFAQDFKTSKKYLDDVLLNEASPYYYESKFLRAEICQKLKTKDWKTARRDLTDINMRALSSSPRRFGLATKADCIKAKTYEDEGNKKKAFGNYKMLATSVILAGNSTSDLTTLSDKEKSDILLREEWEEVAVYKLAVLASTLGNNEWKQKAIKAYKSKYPKGGYITEINKIK